MQCEAKASKSSALSPASSRDSRGVPSPTLEEREATGTHIHGRCDRPQGGAWRWSLSLESCWWRGNRGLLSANTSHGHTSTMDPGPVSNGEPSPSRRTRGSQRAPPLPVQLLTHLMTYTCIFAVFGVEDKSPQMKLLGHKHKCWAFAMEKSTAQCPCGTAFNASSGGCPNFRCS